MKQPFARQALLIEDHPLMVEAVAHTIQNAMPGMRLVKAYSWREAQTYLYDTAQSYAFIISDLQMPGTTFDQTLNTLRQARPHTPIMALSVLNDVPTTRLCAHHRIWHLSKTTAATLLASTLMVCLGPELWQHCISLPISNTHPLRDLTPRQLRILQELAQGHKNREIAERLCISEETVHTHLSALFKRLNVKNRTQACKLYLQHGDPHGSGAIITPSWL